MKSPLVSAWKPVVSQSGRKTRCTSVHIEILPDAITNDPLKTARWQSVHQTLDHQTGFGSCLSPHIRVFVPRLEEQQTMAESAQLPGIRINSIDDHYCFGCGKNNPNGLHLHFYELDDSAIQAPFTPRREHEGYAGMVHGGIIATVLDEVMAWALYRRDTWGVTARMEIAFKRPVEVGVPTRAIGRVLKDRGRLIEVSGEIRRLADDQLLAEASATFARVPQHQAEAWRSRYVRTSDADVIPD